MADSLVGIVIVSHSSKIAEGVVELGQQMAPDVAIVAAGGTDDNQIGTSFTKVMEALALADSGQGVVVLTDLGSAVLTTESALEFLDDEARSRVRMAHAALVKGAIASATSAQQGLDVDKCCRAAEMALHPAGEPENIADADVKVKPMPEGTVVAKLEVLNKAGLHARPASKIVQIFAQHNVEAQINQVNARSVMSLMTISLPQGSTMNVEISGDNAEAALADLVAFVDDAFGEER